MKHLKKATIEWARAKKVKEEEGLKHIGVELVQIESPEEDGYETEGKRDMIKLL